MTATDLTNADSGGDIAGSGAGRDAGADPWWRRRDPMVAAGATVALAVLSVAGIGSKQLWIDEGVAVGLAKVPFARFTTVITSWEVNQAPFYVLFRAWSALGDDVATMRLLSALLAVVTVPVIYRLGRRLYGPRAGSYAAVVLAVNGLVLQWAQQIRGYTLALLLITLATLLLVRLVDRPSLGRGVLYAVVAAAAAASHFFCGLVIVAQLLSLLVLKPRPTRVLVATAAVIAVLGAPLLWFIATTDGQPLSWVEQTSVDEVGRLFVRLAGGGLPLLAYCAVGAFGLWATYRVVRRAPRSVESWHHLLPVCWLGFTLGVAIAYSLLVDPIVVARFFLIVVPAIALLVGLGLASVPTVPGRAVAGVALVATSLLGCLTWYRSPSREDWTAVATSMLPDLRPGDTVVVIPGNGGPTPAYYVRELGGVELPLIMPDTSRPPTADRLWELRRGPEISGWWERQGLEPWMDRYYDVVRTDEFRNVTVRLHERPR